ncbi:MAG TPA: NAD(P)-dependent oxidoreductase [Solirubrobacteraceae bacterium]|nr:NAD(P)-dependent oxidoreductase [Solirubrobacteraceae bacterium]
MTILLTGATGFIGRHLLALLAGDQEVVALARRAPPAALAGTATWTLQDLAAGLDPSGLPARVDTVVHLAQSNRYRDFPEGASDVVAVNVGAVVDLLDYARAVGARRFVLCSTGGVYGFRAGVAREDDPVAPDGFYAGSKYAAELLLAPYRALLQTVVVRPFFVYGAGQRGMLVAGLAERVLRGEPVTIAGDPGLRVNPIHVEDAARAIAAAAGAEATVDVVNVAGDETVTLRDIVLRLARAADVEPTIVHAGDGPPGDLVGDNERMRRRLGVTPQVALDDGLAGVVAALRRADGG